MKISLNWVREFTDIKCSTEELVAKIGAQLGEVDEVIELGPRYEGIVAAKVVACDKHPNADKLSVCKIDDGGVNKQVKRDEKGLVQVVCGAPNVRAGITVAWIPPGAIVPSTYEKEQFKLDVRPLRGVDSNGMIGSGKELAINDDHDGILILDKPAKPGTPLTKVYDFDDVIVDVENKMFTHRPDCFGMLGVAREIAGIQHLKFTSPEWYQKVQNDFSQADKSLKLTVKNEVLELAPRFMAVPMSGVEVKPSPLVMQSYLTRLGIKPINNVVDITNFMMLLTAQPLHAYDYDKVAAQDKSTEATLVIRKPKKNEQLALLNGKTIEPRKDAIMIATKERLIGVGGVMGGVDTEVDESTKNIILECANFDMYSIRRTSMEHGLFTDAVTRFNKGQSSLQNDRVLAHTMQWLTKHASAEVAGEIIDNQRNLPHLDAQKITHEFVNERLGTQLTDKDMAKLLTNVEFIAHTTDDIQVTPPFWRTDIEIREDIVEEVGRLYGYDHLPKELPKRSIKPPVRNAMLDLKSEIRQILSSAGANELLTYSFVHGKLLENVGQDKEQAFKISNALSPDLQYYRLSLTPSLLEKVHPNIKAGHDEFVLYEMNKVHVKNHNADDGLPVEEQRLAVVFAASDKLGREKSSGAAYYQAKVYLEYLLSRLGIEVYYESSTTHDPKYQVGLQALAPFERQRTAYIKTKKEEELIGIIGEISAETRNKLKLPNCIAGFELDTQQLQKFKSPRSYRTLSKYPHTEQDITFKVKESVTYEELFEVLRSRLEKQSEKHGYTATLTPIDIYQEKKSKNITFRLTLVHSDRTLTTEEVNILLDNLSELANKKLSAQRV